jgi:tRNA A-37 threonylcarbamoyl transferase component Bud32/tetratricopeptide (TPR) repeat protein
METMHDDAPTGAMTAVAGEDARDDLAWAHALVGTELVRYRIESLRGVGGFGAVFEAEQLTPVRRRVALKIPNPALRSAVLDSRFEDEAQSLATMRHPGIATILDAGVLPGGLPFMAMEFVEGRPFDDAANDLRLPLERRIALLASVCDAVQHAHAKGIVHRDLKPANVLLEEGDRGLRTKVIDFGVAAFIDDPRTADGMHGTPAFMSPEQLGGTVDIDTRSDVWALGVMLFQQLTGVLPWLPSGDRTSDARRLATGTACPKVSAQWAALGAEQPMLQSMEATRRATVPARHARAVRGDLEAICMRCLAADREQRYPSAAALAADLRAWLQHDPVSAMTQSAGYRARCLARKYPRTVVGTGIAAVVLLGAVVAMGVLWQQARAAEAEAVASRQRAERTLGTFLGSLRAADAIAASSDAAITIPALLDRIEENAQAALADDADALASVRDTVAVVYLANQDFQSARRNLDAAVAHHRAELERTASDTERRAASIELADSLHQLGRASWLLQDEAGSHAAFTESLVLREDASPEATEAIADTMQMVAALEQKRGDTARSDALSERSLVMLRAAGLNGSDAHVSALMTRGNTMLRAGRTDEAMECFGEVARVLAAAGRPDDWRAGRALSQLALLQAKAGDTMGALPNFERALEITERRFGTSHQLATSIHHRIAELLWSQRIDPAQARTHVMAAVDGRRLDGRRPGDVALSLELAARIERDAGDRAQAIALQRGALDVRRAANPLGDEASLRSTATLGTWLADDGACDAAKPLLLEALERAGARAVPTDRVPSADTTPTAPAAKQDRELVELIDAARTALARCSGS